MKKCLIMFTLLLLALVVAVLVEKDNDMGTAHDSLISENHSDIQMRDWDVMPLKWKRVIY